MIKGSNSVISIMENNRNSLTINRNGSGGAAAILDIGPVGSIHLDRIIFELCEL